MVEMIIFTVNREINDLEKRLAILKKSKEEIEHLSGCDLESLHQDYVVKRDQYLHLGQQVKKLMLTTNDKDTEVTMENPLILMVYEAKRQMIKSRKLIECIIINGEVRILANKMTLGKALVIKHCYNQIKTLDSFSKLFIKNHALNISNDLFKVKLLRGDKYLLVTIYGSKIKFKMADILRGYANLNTSIAHRI